ncbi:MAG: antibiotic biosynthesis monooxygenase [Actinomycetota bacterium]
MGKVTMMGTITCQAGKGDEMAAVLAKMVDAAKEEPGVEVYSYHRGEGDTFAFFALMSSADSMQGHGQSEAMQAAMADFMPLMAAPPEMTMFAPVAAIGLDL